MLAILGNTLNQNVTVGIDACLTQLNEQHTPNLPKSTICKYIHTVAYSIIQSHTIWYSIIHIPYHTLAQYTIPLHSPSPHGPVPRSGLQLVFRGTFGKGHCHKEAPAKLRLHRGRPKRGADGKTMENPSCFHQQKTWGCPIFWRLHCASQIDMAMTQRSRLHPSGKK